MASVTITVKKNMIDKKLQQIMTEAQNRDTMTAIYNNLAKKCDPYVPFLTGALAQSNEVNPKGTAYPDEEGVHYIQPYARYQYYGVDFNHTVEYHQLATAMWDKAMMRDKGDEFRQEVKEILEEFVRRHNAR